MKDLRSTPLAQSLEAALADPRKHYFVDVGSLANEVTDTCACCGKPRSEHDPLVPEDEDE